MNAATQDRPPNFRTDDGRLFLVRCYACNPERGRENWAMAVASGTCAFCGWTYKAAGGERQPDDDAMTQSLHHGNAATGS